MPLTFPKLRFRQIASALLVLAVLIMAAAFVKNLLRPRGYTVADAETRLKKSKSNLEKAKRVIRLADKLAQGIGLTNSTVPQTIQSVGAGVILKLEREHIGAAGDLDYIRRVTAADHCIQEYKEFNQAQEAVATLTLSGIKDFVIRPPGRRGNKDDQSHWQLLVPGNLTATTVAALNNTQIRELKIFYNDFDGMNAMQNLESHSIPATIRHLTALGHGDAPVSIRVLYVLRADEEIARKFLDSSAGVNDASSNKP